MYVIISLDWATSKKLEKIHVSIAEVPWLTSSPALPTWAKR